jgi:hypothetical protein
MNSEYTQSNINKYEGNGWSKYQLMVLQQLDDHNKVLQNLNKEIVDLKQTIAVSEAEQKMWKAQIISLSDNLTEKIDYILYDDNSVASRLNKIEKNNEVQERTSMKIKAVWAFYGAILVFLIEFFGKILPFIWQVILSGKH